MQLAHMLLSSCTLHIVLPYPSLFGFSVQQLMNKLHRRALVWTGPGGQQGAHESGFPGQRALTNQCCGIPSHLHVMGEGPGLGGGGGHVRVGRYVCNFFILIYLYFFEFNLDLLFIYCHCHCVSRAAVRCCLQTFDYAPFSG